ncbi:MAG TPA: FlgD immunoglobulin-like domain containing protein [bacterium]|nr:FlgD immunoglobulin-like domain containing protein [bacterium]HPN43739.1 FlgD immunoglobulin-like domain containing protein [bacterium]
MSQRNLYNIALLLFTTNLLLPEQNILSSLLFAQQQFLDSSTQEFLVNDDVQGGCQQAYPVIARDDNGNYVMAWGDMRNGRSWGGNYYYRGWDIYMQRFDAVGNPLGANQKVNDNNGYLAGSLDHPLSVAMNKNGRFVIVWEDLRPGPAIKQDIYFQIFDADGSALGPNQKANEDDETDQQRFPAVAMDDQGGFIITWQNIPEDWGDFKILLRKFSADGVPSGASQPVNNSVEKNWTNQGGPVIAMDDMGSFAISWVGQINDNWDPDILIQRFDAAAAPLGEPLVANDDTVHCEQVFPALAMNEQGEFIVTWQDARNSQGADVDYFDIYFQRFDSTGAAVGTNILVNDDNSMVGQFNPDVAVNANGQAIVVWQDNRFERGKDAIYYQQYDAQNNARGVNRIVHTGNNALPQTNPHVISNETGQFTIIWQDCRDGALNQDVYYQYFDAAGIAVTLSQKANDDTGSADQLQPAVAVDGQGGYIIAWVDERNAGQESFQLYDIYFQQYNASGNPLGPNRRVNDNASSIRDPFPPAVAADAEGNFVIAWTDSRVHSWDIYCQRYNASGETLGENTLVNNDDNYDGDERSPAIAMNPRGDYVIAWTFYYGWDCVIQYQVFDDRGRRVGDNHPIEHSIGGDWPAVAMDDSGRFAIAWYRDAYYDINGVVTIISDVYTQIFDAEGNPLGKACKVNDVTTGKRGAPAMAMNNVGEFVLAWQDNRNGTQDIFFQRYDANNNAIGANQKANDNGGLAAPYSPAVVLNNSGDFVLIWADERLEPQTALLTGQYINADGSRNGENFVISESLYSLLPAAAANPDKIVFVWQDNRRSKGFDIYAKVTAWDDASSITDTQSLPQSHALLQNYPNPFNPQTVISYRLGAAGRVNITIYNITGQQVCNLLDTRQEAGIYQVTWNGTDSQGNRLNSGIFFCRLQIENNGAVYTMTEKLCLVK